MINLGTFLSFAVIWRELWWALGGFRSQIAVVLWGLGGLGLMERFLGEMGQYWFRL
jgi:hypothetical protein